MSDEMFEVSNVQASETYFQAFRTFQIIQHGHNSAEGTTREMKL